VRGGRCTCAGRRLATTRSRFCQLQPRRRLLAYAGAAEPPAQSPGAGGGAGGGLDRGRRGAHDDRSHRYHHRAILATIITNRTPGLHQNCLRVYTMVNVNTHILGGSAMCCDAAMMLMLMPRSRHPRRGDLRPGDGHMARRRGDAAAGRARGCGRRVQRPQRRGLPGSMRFHRRCGPL
jgi:hypothetical protein